MWFFPVVGSRMMATLFAFRTTAKRSNVVSESDYQTPPFGRLKTPTAPTSRLQRICPAM